MPAETTPPSPITLYGGIWRHRMSDALVPGGVRAARPPFRGFGSPASWMTWVGGSSSSVSMNATIVQRVPSEELQGLLDEVLVELEDTAVARVGVDDEVTVRESSVEVDGVAGGHHPVVVAVHDEHGSVDGREVRGLLQAPPV